METSTVNHRGASKTGEQVFADEQPDGHESKHFCNRVGRILTCSQIAEELYTKGWISYPRTETDSFDKGIDLKALIQKQTHDQVWGPYAQG